jgi:putative drug exporter of the RND superfamily
MHGLMLRLSHGVRRWLVQLAFMPALIVLLGDRVWWLPGWLDRVLPRIELD